MVLDRQAIVTAIKAQVIAIAARLDSDASDLQANELIPASGFIDSAGLLELVAWYEDAYDIRVSADEFTVDNLGTIDAMADFVLARKGAR